MNIQDGMLLSSVVLKERWKAKGQHAETPYRSLSKERVVRILAVILAIAQQLL